MRNVTIVSENCIIIRTENVWYMVSFDYIERQAMFSRNQIFKDVLEFIEKKKGK
jgi:hypothetical protein